MNSLNSALELLGEKWLNLYRVYDMIDSSFAEYEEIKKELEAIEIVIELLKKDFK